MNTHSQRGVALVITLVMLAVVTFMAITFLALSRRERAAVTVTEEQTVARQMSETARSRAQIEVVARMLQETNLLSYGMMVSTNYTDPQGFDPGQSPLAPNNYTNVNYDLRRDGRPLTTKDRLTVMTNLFLDPRAPVYVRTNESATAPLDFRFYLDYNRDGLFESNGVLPVVSPRGLYYSLATGAEVQPSPGVLYVRDFLVGDPEWIGVLQYPDLPHSATNRFVGRYAFIVLPAGKSLDLNYIHNNARTANLSAYSYFRNEGFGSWELNLAAFFRDLNTNLWRGYEYRGITPSGPTDSFRDAFSVLAYRYGYDYRSLSTVRNLFGNRGANSFMWDHIDGYSDGPPSDTIQPLREDLAGNRDDPDRPWAGSPNTNSYFEAQEFFDPLRMTNRIAVGLQELAATNVSTYDRYTFYRLLSQMGMDSPPASQGRVNLNYDNLSTNAATIGAGPSATNFVPWQPVTFFTNVAERLFQTCRWTNITTNAFNRLVTNYIVGDRVVRQQFSLTNIWIYPYSEYSPAVHRLLQVAANLYDASTNRALTPYPYLPSVFRPVFRRIGTNIFIAGYTEATNTTFLSRPFLDLNDPRDRDQITDTADVNVYGVPLVVGAKKGLPNFSEIALLNVAQVSRKLELRKQRATDTVPNLTNQMYLLTVSNVFGLESWNSYTQDVRRALEVRVLGTMQLTLSNAVSLGGTTLRNSTNRTVVYSRILPLSAWASNEFKLPIFTNLLFLPESVYRPAALRPFEPATTNSPYQQGLGYYVPQWDLLVTNRFYYALVDRSVTPARILDYVSLANMTVAIDITSELVSVGGGGGNVTGAGGGAVGGAVAATPAGAWGTNRLNARVSDPVLAIRNVPTEGVMNQVLISLGILDSSQQLWTSFSLSNPDGLDKNKSIDHLRQFVGLSPLYTLNTNQLRADLAGKVSYQAGYSPVRKVFREVTWQANDPLVHYIFADLQALTNFGVAVPPQIPVTNANLGMLNDVYSPWGGNPNKSSTNFVYDVRLKDPWVSRSDDWDFPTNKYPNVGWIGRVHRGTPWQTIYLKSDRVGTNYGWGMDTNVLNTTNWYRWSGSFGTHPTNDWRFVDLFTVAPNDNAARGLLSVNQTNVAAWSAALSGQFVFTSTGTTNGQPGYVTSLIGPATLPAGLPLQRIVEGINLTRSQQTNGVFNYQGQILATPELTFASPFLGGTNVSDAVLERIPQQLMSLLREDTPRFVVYAFGQSLREAPNSVYLESGPFYRLCTNYQVRGEYVTKTVFRIEGPITNPRAVVESYNELPVP